MEAYLIRANAMIRRITCHRTLATCLYVRVTTALAALGTESHFGFDRLADNRPNNAFGFHVFEANNRNRHQGLSGLIFGRLVDLMVFLRQVRTR